MKNRLLKLLRSLIKGEGVMLFLEVSLLLLLLYWKFQHSITRYFDIDEYAYLHWGYNFYLGERPYVDFFYLLPPLFLYPLSWIFAVFGRTTAVLVEARALVFIIFLATGFLLFLISRKLRDTQTALLTLIIFSFLPLPADKMIEIRPDLLALFFALLGLYLFISGISAGGNFKKLSLFFCGLSYSVSLAIIPKTVFFLLPVIMVIFLPKLRHLGSLSRLSNLREKWLILGLTIPTILTLVQLFSFGNFRFAVYSMTRLASDVHKTLGAKFYLIPSMFFLPNDAYYGVAGFGLPYIMNLVIYVPSYLWGILRLVSSLSYPDRNKCIREFLAGSCFYINLFVFVNYYPLKHTQYLIAVAPFTAFYFADMIEAIRGRFRHAIPEKVTPWHRQYCQGVTLTQLILLVLLGLVGLAGREMYEKKLAWTNKKTLDRVNLLLETIPKDERVFDLTGGSIFFRHGYYFCCLSYGQYEEILKFPIPNLERELAKNKTRFVNTDYYGRLEVLPAIQQKYLKENFVPYFPDGSMLIKKQ